MLKRLPENFELDRYGLHVRLVKEEDAEFIVKLRTDPKLSRFIHDIKSGVEQQKEWIRAYKQREKNGTEYYFIYFVDGEPCGLNRLYDIKEDGTFNGGSWVFAPSSYELASVASVCIQLEIAFNDLGLTDNIMPDAVHIDNHEVLKFNKMLGSKVYGEIEDVKGKYYQLSRSKADFFRCEKKLLFALRK